jgi:hypothetical protein
MKGSLFRFRLSLEIAGNGLPRHGQYCLSRRRMELFIIGVLYVIGAGLWTAKMGTQHKYTFAFTIGWLMILLVVYLIIAPTIIDSTN